MACLYPASKLVYKGVMLLLLWFEKFKISLYADPSCLLLPT